MRERLWKETALILSIRILEHGRFLPAVESKESDIKIPRSDANSNSLRLLISMKKAQISI